MLLGNIIRKKKRNWFNSPYIDRVTESACISFMFSFLTHLSSSSEFYQLTNNKKLIRDFLHHLHRNNVNTLRHTHNKHTHTISNNGTKTTYAYCKWKGQQMGHDERQRSQIIGKLKTHFRCESFKIPLFCICIDANGPSRNSIASIGNHRTKIYREREFVRRNRCWSAVKFGVDDECECECECVRMPACHISYRVDCSNTRFSMKPVMATTTTKN